MGDTQYCFTPFLFFFNLVLGYFTSYEKSYSLQVYNERERDPGGGKSNVRLARGRV